MKFRSNQLRNLGLLALCSVFVVIGILMRNEYPIVAYAGIVFFGIGVVVAAIQMLPHASYLELQDEGFKFRTLFRDNFVRWKEVEHFYVIKVHSNKMVGWNYSAKAGVNSVASKVSSKLSGAQAALPETYGKKAEELAEIMNQKKADNA